MAGHALVTGAGSGIGREICLALARRGHGIFGVALAGPELGALEREVRAIGAACETLAVDLTTPTGPREVVAAARASGLDIDTLVNCAGMGLFGEHLDLDPADVSRMITLNAGALTELSTSFAREMRARGRGRILNVASTAAFQPLPHLAAYAATKHYVAAFTLALAEELRDTGVSVALLCPGTTRTPFIAGAGIGAASRAGKMADRVAMEPAEVAAHALLALEGDAPLVIPGRLNRLHHALSRALSPAALSRVFAAATRPARA